MCILNFVRDDGTRRAICSGEKACGERAKHLFLIVTDVPVHVASSLKKTENKNISRLSYMHLLRKHSQPLA